MWKGSEEGLRCNASLDGSNPPFRKVNRSCTETQEDRHGEVRRDGRSEMITIRRVVLQRHLISDITETTSVIHAGTWNLAKQANVVWKTARDPARGSEGKSSGVTFRKLRGRVV